MIKKNPVLIFAAIFLLNFCIANNTFASQDLGTENVHPDYAYIFTGKDRFEKFNRRLFTFNLKLNKYVLRPVNIVWASVMPKYGMDRVQSAYNNMNYPIRLMGCICQKDFKASRQETARFFINTTIGFVGLYDPAKNKFKIEPHQEDMEQALAHTKIKPGPYLVLPVVQGNVRDLIGKLLNCPLRPTSYAGPFGAAANALFTINNTTYTQPMIKKVDETYADPYEIAKEVDGFSDYVKLLNLDRNEVYEEKVAAQNITEISHNNEDPTSKPAADIELSKFNPQGSLVDSMRTSMFDNQKIYNSAWSEMSVWNRNFGKKLNISSISLTPGRARYKYKYLLQKEKSSPLAVIYPSIGDGITSDKSVILGKILYDEGYSVIIQGSAFNWEFVKSMPESFIPGLPAQDSIYLKQTTAKIIDSLEKKKNYKFGTKILVGCSYGALTGIFVAAQDENDHNIGLSKCIAINPPVEMFYAMNKMDKYSVDWKKYAPQIKEKTALATEKIIRVSNSISKKEVKDMPENMPFTEDEAKLVIGFLMKIKMYDVVFAIDNCKRCKKSGLYDKVNKMKFSDYANEYLSINDNYDQLDYENSLYNLVGFLNNNKNYKIYHSVDDYFVNTEQLNWLKKQTNNQSVYFSNGSHLGEMYRKEFLDQFKKDIHFKATSVKPKL